MILVNSVTQYDDRVHADSESYLQFNGCTNFNTKITLAIPLTSCSSDATGVGSGLAGLVYSAALNARARASSTTIPTRARPAGSSNGDPVRDQRRTRSAS